MISSLDEFDLDIDSIKPKRNNIIILDTRHSYKDIPDMIMVDDLEDMEIAPNKHKKHLRSNHSHRTLSEETSESSPSFTIKSEEEHKVDHDDIQLELLQKKHKLSNAGYMNLKSPTDGHFSPNSMVDMPGTPNTPNLPKSPPRQQQQPTESNENILHSFKLRKNTDPGDTPPGMKLSLPKPKTKGQWM